MKKLWIAFAIAMAALMIFASPALAWGGSDADADVDCSDIDVTDDAPFVGSTITFSGTVDITAEANARGFISMARANSYAYYEIYDPESNIVDEGSSHAWDWEFGFCSADADAGQTFVWSADVYIDLVGDYVAKHGGSAFAFYFTKRPFRPFRIGADFDSCSVERTVTSRSAVIATMSAIHPYLVIQLPAGGVIYEKDHAKKFFGSDGWGNPTSDFIVYSDGIWQVEIDDGTVIELDGERHKVTWIGVDDQGNVIGRYGSDGHIIAEEIGLSSPITVTKVG